MQVVRAGDVPLGAQLPGLDLGVGAGCRFTLLLGEDTAQIDRPNAIGRAQVITLAVTGEGRVGDVGVVHLVVLLVTGCQGQRAATILAGQRPDTRLGTGDAGGGRGRAVGGGGRRHQLEAAEVRAVVVDGVALATLEHAGAGAVGDGGRVAGQQERGTEDAGVAAADVAEGALERGVPVADEEVAEAAAQADRAVAGAEAVAVDTARIRGGRAGEPGGHAAAELLFTAEADFRTRGLQHVGVGAFGATHVLRLALKHLHGALRHRGGRHQCAGNGDCDQFFLHENLLLV